MGKSTLMSLFLCLGFSLGLGCVNEDAVETPEVSGGEVAVAKAEVGKGAEAKASDCEDRSFCTREYRPTVCRFSGQEFKSSNPCEAMKLARRYACEKKLSFSDSAVDCQAHEASEVER